MLNLKPLHCYFFICFIIFSFTVKAQKNVLYDYQDLSSQYYSKQKDSLKKAWVCKPVFDSKATQKKYKEIWGGRTDFLLESLKDDNYVYNSEILAYINGIVDQLVKSNKTLISEKPLVLLDRSPEANAYAVGSNVLSINLGMITFVRNREELALIIAHELSHNILEHPETGMMKKAEWLTSDEYKQNMDAILDSKYERFSRLKKVFEEYSFGRNRHQRYKESDADSLAIVMLKNSKIPFDPVGFLRLDSADMQYKQNLNAALKTYFTPYNIEIDEAWTKKRSKGLSSRTYNFKDSTNLDDSLKTHPDCIDRYARTKKYATQGGVYSPLPESVKQMANKMLIWELYREKSLTPCLYRILLEKDKGNTDKWYDFMFYNVFTGLASADKDLSRFNAIGVVPKESISKSYYELQTMLEQVPRESLAKFCKTIYDASFWSKMDASEKAFKKFMYTIAVESEPNDPKIISSAKEYSSTYSTSLYREITTFFEKK